MNLFRVEIFLQDRPGRCHCGFRQLHNFTTDVLLCQEYANRSVDKITLPNLIRSMPTDTALMNLVKDSTRHEEVFQLFNSTAFDFFDHDDGQVWEF